MLTASVWSYREMALMNIAGCHAQLGDIAAAKRYYHRVQEEFPENRIVSDLLKFIDAVRAEPET